MNKIQNKCVWMTKDAISHGAEKQKIVSDTAPITCCKILTDKIKLYIFAGSAKRTNKWQSTIYY